MKGRTNNRLITKRLKELVTKGWTNTGDGTLVAPGYVTKACIEDSLDSERFELIKKSKIVYMNEEEKFQVMELLKGKGLNPTDRKFVKL